MHLVLLLFALFASIFTLQKESLQFAEPFFLVGTRMAFAGVLLLGYELIIKRRSFKFKLQYLLPLVMLGVANIYLTNILEIWGLSKMDSSKACLIYSLSPFLAALVAFLVLKEKLSARKWLGMLIGFAGLLPILYIPGAGVTGGDGAGGTSSGPGSFFSLGIAELAVIGATFFSVYGWILLKKVINEQKLTPMLANGFSMLLGGILAILHSYAAGEAWQPLPVSNIPLFISYSLAICLISNIICYNLYGYLLKRFSATFLSFSGLVTPLFASLFGFVFLKEHIQPMYFVSLTLFAIGLTIFYAAELKQTAELKQAEIAKQPEPLVS